MGYDIYSMREDREQAIAYDKAWGNTFWFNKDTGEYERRSSSVYYRLNIWGMAVLRDIHAALGIAEINEALWDNSGTVIRDWECRNYADFIAEKSDAEIRAAVEQALVAHDEYPKGDDVEEEVAGWVKEVRAWGDFLNRCADLKGAEVC